MIRSLLVVLLSSVAFGSTLPYSAYRLERTLPDTTLAFLHVPSGKKVWQALGDSPFARLLRDQEMQEFLGPVLQQLDQMIGQQKKGISQALGMPFEEAIELIDGQIAVALVDLDPSKDVPFKLVFSMDAPEKRERLLKVREFIERSLWAGRGREVKEYEIGDVVVTSGPTPCRKTS